MAKVNEQAYIDSVVRVDRVSREDFERYLLQKPWADRSAGSYLIDIGQILRLLPAPPVRVLDIGCGSGWTSEFFARCGYSVRGVDIAEDMIALAARRAGSGLPLEFAVADFEQGLGSGEFDVAVSYDALHHAENERLVIRAVYEALKPGGLFVLIEPGRGHSRTPDTLEAVRKYGVTERDMPFDAVGVRLLETGFSSATQRLRLSQAPLFDLPEGHQQQIHHLKGWVINTVDYGLTSVIVATK